ncbi:hypothetical protein [Streptomyces sp. ODS28]|uniref:hypothetical protein n=1 Tax=Streptomyces sp. ODS28 TaxID=3136688 RepID=UPI0031EE9C0E
MTDDDTWQHEYVPDEAFIVGGIPGEGLAEVEGVIRGLLELAELRLEAGNDYDEQNPQRLRTISTDRLILWYQKFDDRKRIYTVRVTWLD